MKILLLLIPISIFLGILGLVFFLFTVKTRQYEDLQGNSQRILNEDFDERPKSIE